MRFVIPWILLSARILLPGLLWLPERHLPPERTFLEELVASAGRIVGLGLVLNLLAVLAASAFQCWTPRVDWVLWALVVAGGLSRLRAGTRPAAAAGASALVALLVAAVLAAPIRSEWSAGGWDPGVYQNNAVSIAARQGTQPLRGKVFERLSEAERELASTPEGAYREVFPGVPIDRRDGRLPLYFFPLNSLCGAWLHRLGGHELLHRMPMMLAWLGWLSAVSLLLALDAGKTIRRAALLSWVISPLWWYHQAVPVSEMMQLLLLCSSALFYVDSVEKRSRFPVVTSLCLFAGTLNRFDFPVFAGFFLLLAARTELAAGRAGWQGRVACGCGALCAGILWNFLFAGVTLSRLQEKDHVLWVVLLPFFSFALAAALLAHGGNVSRRTERLGRSMLSLAEHFLLAAVLVLAVVALASSNATCAAVLGRIPILAGIASRVSMLLAWHGSWWFGAVAIGVLASSRASSPEGVRMWRITSALGLVLLALLLHGGIALIYPWALRRYMVFLVPFMALAHGALARWTLDGIKARRWPGAVAGVILLALAVRDGAARSLPAASVGDYKGMTAVLSMLDSHLREGDVVVADDPRWGTPLLLMHGRDVVDGKRLWTARDEAFQGSFLAMLRRLQDEDRRRIVWLTSTDRGLELYPMPLGGTSPLVTGIPFRYRTVVHGARAFRFADRENVRSFSLHVWVPGDPTSIP